MEGLPDPSAMHRTKLVTLATFVSGRGVTTDTSLPELSESTQPALDLCARPTRLPTLFDTGDSTRPGIVKVATDSSGRLGVSRHQQG